MNKTARDFMEGRDRVERMASWMQNYFGTAWEQRGETCSVPENREVLLKEHGPVSRMRKADLENYSFGLDGFLYIPLGEGRTVRVHCLLKWLPEKHNSTFPIKDFGPHPTTTSFEKNWRTFIFIATTGGTPDKPKLMSIFTAREAIRKTAVRYGGEGSGNRNRISVTISKVCSFRSVGGVSGFFGMSADDKWEEFTRLRDGSLEGVKDEDK